MRLCWRRSSHRMLSWTSVRATCGLPGASPSGPNRSSRGRSNPHLLAAAFRPLPANLVAVVADARTEPVPAGVTVAVLLMRHCTHYALYVEKLRAAGCRRLITNARWGMGVEVIDLGPGVPFDSVGIGWYACRRCGAVGFAGDDVALRWSKQLSSTFEMSKAVRCA